MNVLIKTIVTLHITIPFNKKENALQVIKNRSLLDSTESNIYNNPYNAVLQLVYESDSTIGNITGQMAA